MEPSEPDESCWKKIGTFGDRSCPELERLAHCRNCPVYSAAGRRLLDREFPEGYRQEWTERLAGGKETGTDESLSVIIFRLRDELLALKTVFFQQASEAVDPHIIPLRSGDVFKGIVNVNGELLLCVSVSALLGISGEESRVDDRKVYRRLIVISKDSQRFAFPADEVFGVRRFPQALLQELPATVSRSVRALTSGIIPWHEQTVGLLEEEKFFAALSRSLNA